MLTLEKAHKYNLECDEREAKQRRQEAAAAQRAHGRKTSMLKQPSAAPGGMRMPGMGGKAGIGVDSELAAKLAKRNQGRTNLVDGVAEGMANGIRVREGTRPRKEKSFERRRKQSQAFC